MLAIDQRGDLIANEAQYHCNILSSCKNRYRGVRTANSDTGISKEEKVISTQAFADLLCLTLKE